MKKLAPFFALIASPALAHDGAHIHPHGVEALPLIPAVLTIAAGALVAIKVRK